MSAGAREAILEAIRGALAQNAAYPHVDAALLAPAPGHTAQRAPAGLSADADGAGGRDLVERFREKLEAVGGHYHGADDEAEAGLVARRILEQNGVQRVAVSDGASSLLSGVEAAVDPAREQLFECEAGVTTAQAGIAETGSLVLDSSQERHRLISLLPPIHIAFLSASLIHGTLAEALTSLSPGGGRLGRSITLITGPSRTADIELALVIGVHGPQQLHVVVIGASNPRGT